MNPKTLLIVDGQNLLYRGMFTATNFPEWEHQTAEHAICRQFLSRLEDLAHWKLTSTQILVAWDGKGVDPARRTLCPEYKKRKKTSLSDEQKAALFSAKDYLQALLRVTCVDQVLFNGDEPGEADDLIATVITRAAKEDFTVELYSNDKDFFQLQALSMDLAQVIPAKSPEIVRPEHVQARTGLPPSSYIWLKCMDGDTSDNISGFPGVGPKTALELIAKAGMDTWGERTTLAEAKRRFREVLKSSDRPSRMRKAVAVHGVEGLMRILTTNFRMMKLPAPKSLGLNIQGRARFLMGRPSRADVYLAKERNLWIIPDLPRSLLRRRRRWRYGKKPKPQ